MVVIDRFLKGFYNYTRNIFFYFKVNVYTVLYVFNQIIKIAKGDESELGERFGQSVSIT